MTGFVATFLGVFLGGVLARVISRYKKSIGTIYAVCTGAILGLLSFDIAPEVMRNAEWLALCLGLICGVILFETIHIIFELTPSKVENTGLKTGLFLTIILSLHNLPLGVVVSTDEHSTINSPLIHTLLFHSVPEGMILFTPLFLTGMSIQLLVVLSFIVALPVATGTFIGQFIDIQNHAVWTFLLSMSIASVYLVTIKEILPQAVKYSSNRYSVFIAVLSFCLLGAFMLYS